MAFKDLLICPKGFLKIVNLILAAIALLCLRISEIGGGPAYGYYEGWIASLTITIILDVLIILFVGAFNFNRHNKAMAIFYIFAGILIGIGTCLSFPILAELNRVFAEVENITIPGYWEFVVGIIQTIWSRFGGGLFCGWGILPPLGVIRVIFISVTGHPRLIVSTDRFSQALVSFPTALVLFCIGSAGRISITQWTNRLYYGN